MDSRRNNYFIFRNLAAIKTAQELAGDFPDIRFILLKGAALFSFARSNDNNKSDDKIFLLRPTEDVDVLLAENSEYDKLLSSQGPHHRHAFSRISFLEEKGYRKVKNDSQTYRKFTTENFLLPIDFHRRIWYIPDDKTHEKIIARAVPAGVGYPPNLLRLRGEDLWVDIAVHSVFHHTLRPSEKAADLDFLEGVCPIDKRIVADLLDDYFGAGARNAVIDSVRQDKWKDLRRYNNGEGFIENCRYIFYKKFIASDFPAKGFAARCFLVRRRQGIAGKIKFFMREILFPPADFVRRRYDLKSHLAVKFFQFIRPFIVGAKAAASLLFLKTNIPFSNK